MILLYKCLFFKLKKNPIFLLLCFKEKSLQGTRKIFFFLTQKILLQGELNSIFP